jgi:hypothetical protein
METLPRIFGSNCIKYSNQAVHEVDLRNINGQKKTNFYWDRYKTLNVTFLLDDDIYKHLKDA